MAAAVSNSGTEYILRVTAGPSYHPDTQVEVPVNTPDPIRIEHELMDIELNVRIKGYAGLPRNSPQSSSYFVAEPHATNDDRYSICFRFTPKPPKTPRRPASRSLSVSSNLSASAGAGAGASASRSCEVSPTGSDDPSTSLSSPPAPAPATTANGTTTTVNEVAHVPEPAGIPATDLQFGNDFAYPIRDRLPPGFHTAMGIVKWWIDPGLEGDAYSDTPHLYGPVLSSINVVHVGEGQFDEDRGGLWFEEGGDDRGVEWRKNMSAPDTGRERMKWALAKENKEAWVWEWGRTYGADFFNPYLNFADFSLRLPGFSLPLMKYLDTGTQVRRSHHLRYVLRNRSTGDTYLVVVFTLHRRDDVNEEGTVNPAARQDGADGDTTRTASDSGLAGNADTGERERREATDSYDDDLDVD